MTQTKMKHPVLATEFGIPHHFKEYAENYANFRVQEYIENQAKIEMRKKFEKWAMNLHGYRGKLQIYQKTKEKHYELL